MLDFGRSFRPTKEFKKTQQKKNSTFYKSFKDIYILEISMKDPKSKFNEISSLFDL